MAGEKILIVDDTGFSRIFIQHALARPDCEYVHAVDGQSALNLLSSQRFDLVISDFVMPEMDGLDLYRRALGSRFSDDLGPIPCPPFIIITAHASPELKETARHLGILAVVQKSSQEAELSQLVGEALAGTACRFQITLSGNEALRMNSLSQTTGISPRDLAVSILKSFLSLEEIEEIGSVEDIARRIRVAKP